jgi:PAS domain S-box-containing protein
MRRFSSRFSLVPFVVKDHSKWVAFSFAVFLAYCSVWVSVKFWESSGGIEVHTMLALSAVFIAGVMGGFFPGLIATLTSTCAMIYFLKPTGTYIVNVTDRVWIGIYFLLALGAARLASELKAAIQNRTEESERLEKEIERRTSELTNANQELRRVLAEIEESRSFLDSLIDHLPLPIYLKNVKDLTIAKANRAAREMFKEVDNLVGKTAFDVFPEESARRITEEEYQSLKTSSIVRHEETFWDPKLGQRTFSINKVPMYNRDKRAIYILATVEDITEKRRVEEQRIKLIKEQAAREEAERKKWELEEAIRARDTFLSICSHELKTPLTSLKLQAGVIRMLFEKSDIEALSSPKVRELVLDTDKEINRINRLINDMLDVSRIRSGKLTLHPGQVDLSDVVREVVSHFRSIPTYKDVEIKVELPDHAVGVWDRNRIEQIVINLLSNALKYGRGKPVRVNVNINEKDAYLMVEDQGVGIGMDDQARIFQRFERASASESISGLGLGLYIVKEIVTMHEGEISVESEVGKGSKFTVKLPLQGALSTKAA